MRARCPTVPSPWATGRVRRHYLRTRLTHLRLDIPADRAVPWAGAGLALVLDAVASLLSGGRATHDIDGTVWAAGQVSQVFIAIEPSTAQGLEGLDAIVADLHSAQPAVRAPGQGMYKARAESEAHGVAVDAALWETIQGL